MNRQERGEWLSNQVEEAILELEEQISQGHTESFLEVLDFYSRFHKYSLSNTILIFMQRSESTLCAGYKSWEKLGYHVKQGEQAIWIRAPWIRKVPDASTGEIVEKLVGYFAVPVFDRSQLTEKVELPFTRHDLEGDYDTLYLAARVAIGAGGILVDEEPLPTGVHGMSLDGRIVISPKLSAAEKFLCLLHECGHQFLEHHNRHHETTKEQRELVAESVSYLLAKLYGMENPFSRDYILHWKGTITDLHASMTEIHTGVRKIADILRIEPPGELLQAA